ncbi:MAG: Asp-tRNA(Asn)/Glu-tRNA(Gln) amidotransferase subunit GatB [Planctomycetota bacterium]|jgi:aspartyl-tRNA(Asn)/glutamyl-tRNA(Gln) amidotransferase subunit B
MEYTTVIGLEVHVQLHTNSKLFCGCENKFNPDHPNTQTCPVCLGLPGALPVMNRKAFQLSVKTALALNLQVAPSSKWDRKQYYYPDLPKAYQISQYDLPYSSEGYVDITVPSTGETRRVELFRAHLEEDAGKNIHDESGRGGDSHVDLNRCGTPLLEIVSKPDIRSPEEARVFLEELRLLLRYIEVSDCNMQEGSLRCDANVNLHVQHEGETVATPIVEIKNLNTFRGVEAALEYEIKQQVRKFEENPTGYRIGNVPKATHGWNADRGVTFEQRGKEEAADYRYFPDPDLCPVVISEDEIADIRATLCEFPASRRNRYVNELGLSDYDAGVIVDQGRRYADYFEGIVNVCGDGKQAANWLTQEVQRDLNDLPMSIEEFSETKVNARALGHIISKLNNNELNMVGARELYQTYKQSGQLVGPAEARWSSDEVGVAALDRLIAEKGLKVEQDTGKIEAIIDAVVARNEKAAEDVRAGKLQAAGPLIGQVMRELKGADAKAVRQMIIDRLTQ